MDLYLRTLGQLSLRAGGPEGEELMSRAKPLAILAYLATTPDRRARREHLASLLWPGSEPSKRRRSLRQALYYLRQRTGAELTVTEDGELALRTGRLDVDLWAFREALERGAHEEAIRLARGPFLGDYAPSESRELRAWIEVHEDRSRAGLEAAFRQVVRGKMEAGEPRAAAAVAERWVEREALSEEARVALVRARAAAGDHVEAYRAYEGYRTLLREELGDEPGQELEAIADELRELVFPASGPAGDPAVAAPGPARKPEAGAAAEPSAEEETEGTSGGLRTGLRPLLAAGLLLGVLVVAGGLWLASGTPGELRRGDGERDRLRPATYRLTLPGAVTGPGEEPGREVRIRDSEVSVNRVAEPGDVLPAPVGSRRVRRIAVPGGYDLVVEGPTGEHRIEGLPGDDRFEAWSPDGERLLLTSNVFRDGETRRLLYAYGVSDREARRFTPFGASTFEEDAAWFPLGDRVAYAADPEGDLEVWVARADGSRPVNLSRAPGPDRHPAWSPHGRYVAFTSEREGQADVYVVRADGSGLRRLTREPEAER